MTAIDFIIRLRNLGLTDRRFEILHRIRQNPDVKLSELSSACGNITASAITGQIDQLERTGFIGPRTTHPADHRRFVITLTDKAIAALDELSGITVHA